MHTLSWPLFVDQWRPQTRSQAWLYDAVLLLAGSWFLALSAQIAIPVPFSPVPITGQSFGVLVLAMMLGARRGVA
ncbi:MAG: biotin transporter BioY, partial [Myxococcota bacterium]